MLLKRNQVFFLLEVRESPVVCGIIDEKSGLIRMFSVETKTDSFKESWGRLQLCLGDQTGFIKTNHDIYLTLNQVGFCS